MARGRKFPVLGRRGVTISAISGIDTALWDMKGKALGVLVMELLGGACLDEMPAYASGGWANADQIGEQLREYIEKGLNSVQMRVGVLEGMVGVSEERLNESWKVIGREI